MFVMWFENRLHPRGDSAIQMSVYFYVRSIFFSLDIVRISDYMDSRGFVVIVNGMLHNLCEMVNQPMTSYGIYMVLRTKRGFSI